MNEEIGFVIGNGESRIGFNLNTLVGMGPIYGCNALYRDFMPGALFVMDEKMMTEIREVVIPDSTELIHRVLKENNTREFHSSTGEILKDNGYSAGLSAVDVMCRRFPNIKRVFLIGFDITTHKGRFNNVYKDTNCYATSEGKPTYTGHWIDKFGRIFSGNPNVMFHRIYRGINREIPEWSKFSNIKYNSYIQFDLYLSINKQGRVK